MKKLSFLFVSLISLLLMSQPAQAQVRLQRQTLTRPSAIQQVNPEENSDAIFYRSLPRLQMNIPQGEDGHSHEEEPRLNLRLSKARPAQRLPQSNQLWNNRSFVQSSSAQIVSEANLKPTYRIYSGNNYCAAPIVEPELEALYAATKAHMPLYIPYRHSKVTIWQGFYYNWNSKHGAIDMERPALPVAKIPPSAYMP